jgi:asparagine synthase (glutamine-hydrolysing)
MCGIFGYLENQASPDLDQRIADAHATLKHRGPDDRGIMKLPYRNGSLVLGHTRLSIIDLSAAGHQPMSIDGGQLSIVFNGEIYNYIELREELKRLGHQFTTHTDTEVLLVGWKQWGVDILPRITGMFGFVLFDSVKRQLHVARDAFGIKPVFWYADENRIAFGSELPTVCSLLRLKKQLNLQRTYDYLLHAKYDHNDETFIQSVFQLGPGHLLSLDLNDSVDFRRPKMTRWWIPNTQARKPVPIAEAADELRARFLESVKLHLRSDVPLGVALSGGIDSSALVCAMRHLDRNLPIHTFSFIVPGSSINEEPWIDRVNSHVGAIANKVSIKESELVSNIDAVILAQGEPFAGASILAQYKVFELARRNGMKVTLEGQGGDEVLGGYRGYPAERLHSLVEQGHLIKAAKFCYGWSKWPDRLLRRALGGFAAQISPTPIRNYLNSHRAARNTGWLDVNLMRDQGVLMGSPHTRIEIVSKRGRRLVGALARDMTGDLLPHLLRHADRNSMAWSLESRVPFLTIGLADYTLGLPEEYLVSNEGRTKHLFRIAMQGIVPSEILDRRDKIGFKPPDQAWTKHLFQTVPHWLDSVQRFPFLNADKLRTHLQTTTRSESEFEMSAWRILNFLRWADLNDVSC